MGMTKGEKKKIMNKKKIFYIGVIGLILFRIWIALALPLQAAGDMVEDDVLLFQYAKTLLKGEWLGQYDLHTFLKGITYPFFLAVFYKLHIPYSLGIITLYIMACATMVYALKPVIKNQYVSICVFLLLLYSPSMLTTHYVQRLYRMAIIPSFVLLVFGFQIGLFLRIEEKGRCLVWWILGECISIALFWYIREDSVWILPFILVSTAVMIFRIIKGKLLRRQKLKRCIAAILPILAIGCSVLVVGGINYIHYGVFATTDLRTYLPIEYNTFIGNIEKIESDEAIENVKVPRDSILKACDASPTLNTARESIEKFYDTHWTTYGYKNVEGEITGNYYWWALRYSLSWAGHYQDAVETEQFLEKVNDELEQAFETGELTAKEENNIFYTLIEDGESIIDKIVENAKQIIGYSVCGVGHVTGSGNKENVRLMEVMTEGRIIYSDKTSAVSGWLLAADPQDYVEAVICDGEGNELGSVTFTQSEDIYEVYQTENAKQARFSIDISEISNADSLAMEVYLNGEYYTEIDLSKESYGDDGKLIFTIDVGSTAIMTADVLPEDGEDAITIGNGIVKIYQCFAWIVFGVAVIGYIYICLMSVRELKKETSTVWKSKWLIVTAFLLSALVIVFCVCYSYRDAWNANERWRYLAAAFPLIDLFKYSTVVFCSKR